MRSLRILAALALVVACSEPAGETPIPPAEVAPTIEDALTDAHRAAREKRHEEARAAYRAITENAPENAAAWMGLAREALRTDAADDAGEAARRAVELAPEDADAHGLAGLAALGAGEPESAVVALTRVLELDPERAGVRFPLARALERADRREDAIAAYQAAADAGARAAHGLVASARLRIDAIDRTWSPADEGAEDGEGEDEDPFAAAIADLDRAERLAENDEAVLGAIVAQRRRIDEKRRPNAHAQVEAMLLGALSDIDLQGLFGNPAPLQLDHGHAVGGLLGTDLGLAPVVTGHGGGGTGGRALGMGGLGTIGSGGGGSAGGTAEGLGGLRARPPAETDVPPEQGGAPSATAPAPGE